MIVRRDRPRLRASNWWLHDGAEATALLNWSNSPTRVCWAFVRRVHSRQRGHSRGAERAVDAAVGLGWVQAARL